MKEREDFEELKEELEANKKRVNLEIRSQMENYVKEHHGDRKQEEADRAYIGSFLE